MYRSSGAEILPLDLWQNSQLVATNSDHHISDVVAATDNSSCSQRTFTPSARAPFDFSSVAPQVFPSTPLFSPPPFISLIAPSAPSLLGLPVYSASGFDLLNILARVATRRDPVIHLGPVDLTCSFVLVDIRRYDHPIVYCSSSFCTLTGYAEYEVIGRNCRFLQSPGGNVSRGEHRTYTANEAVYQLKRALSADKECQTSLVNYRKDGTPFINLVSVIPIPGDDGEISYHVGFQVDLSDQPHAILEKLRNGNFMRAHSAQIPQLVPLQRDRRHANLFPAPIMSNTLRTLLADPAFLRSIPISTTTTVPTSAHALTVETLDSVVGVIPTTSHHLHQILLEALPDFIHVVSLKGTFLYVAPSVRRVLGYDPAQMVGGAIADYAHPEDVVPLMRELKESSATGAASENTAPRTVDLLFRARTSTGIYVWVESRGRLHVEPGKGRKAIILSGRARGMPSVTWGSIRRGFHVTKREFWGMLHGSVKNIEDMVFLSAGGYVQDILGWNPEELVGRTVGSMAVIDDFAECMRSDDGDDGRTSQSTSVRCTMRRKDRGLENVILVLCPSRVATPGSLLVSQAPVVFRVSCDQSGSLFERNRIQWEGEKGGDNTVPITSLSECMFAELDISRGSSWQYELQQLRFANQRLAEEIAAMEAAIEEAHGPQSLCVDGVGKSGCVGKENGIEDRPRQERELVLPPTNKLPGTTISVHSMTDACNKQRQLLERQTQEQQQQQMRQAQDLHHHMQKQRLYVSYMPSPLPTVDLGMQVPFSASSLANTQMSRPPQLSCNTSSIMAMPTPPHVLSSPATTLASRMPSFPRFKVGPTDVRISTFPIATYPLPQEYSSNYGESQAGYDSSSYSSPPVHIINDSDSPYGHETLFVDGVQEWGRVQGYCDGSSSRKRTWSTLDT